MRFRNSVAAALFATSLASVSSAQTPPAPPAVYQDLYAELSGDISDFDNNIKGRWNGSTFPVAFAGQLTDANSNNGPDLLQQSSFTLVQSEILLLKAIGVKAISVEVSFPMLDANFFNATGHPEYQAQFTTFYANVASAIRAQGLQVIVESQSLIPTGLQSKWGQPLQSYYTTLTFSAYEQERAQTAALVAQTMQPDFFVLQEEPDTESAQSGQGQAGTMSGSTDMLNKTVVAVRAKNIAGMKIGAGFGSWLQEFQLFANSFTRQHCGQTVNGQIQLCLSQPLDFLDMHLFPINEQTGNCSAPPNPKPCTAPNFWQNAMAVVSTANSGGVPLTISQTWLRKVRDGEWLQINGDVQEAREAYSFWIPLDKAFLQTVDDLANYAHMLFVVPFNTQSFSAYLTWTGSSGTCTVTTTPTCTALQGEGGGNTPAQVFGAVQSAGIANANAAAYSDAGVEYHDLIVSDTTAPSNPTNVSVIRNPNSTTADVSWSPATDNVGVAGYHILRNGTKVADIFQSPFHDTGLTPSNSYTYAVQAFDLANNVSATVMAGQGQRRRAVKH